MAKKLLMRQIKKLWDCPRQITRDLKIWKRKCFVKLEEAVRNKELPESETGHRIVLLHKDWLGYTWKEYSAQAHKGLASMYIADERFLAYYDKNIKGCGEFLVKAVDYWAGR